MNRIDHVFAELKRQGGTALIPFLTMGDPDAQTTVDIIEQLEKAGADMIELGVPYSDPLADGPVIQRASERALKTRVTIESCIDIAKQARARGVKLPFIMFTYYNPALQLGLDRFFGLLAKNDISGAIIPDLPIEESDEAVTLSQAHNIHLIPLVAPTSGDRIRKITSTAAGFIYCVSSLGVTGQRSSFYEGITDFLAEVRMATNLPIAVGFGISGREQVENLANHCDGVIVGSAIVRKVEELLPLLASAQSRSSALLQIRDFVRQLKL